jgi:allantoin racemase
VNLLVINPNTTQAMTDKVVAEVARCAGPGHEVTGATARFGCEVIASRASFAIAGHAALDCYAAQRQPFDAVILACFGDPGLAALREIAPQPVVGFAEASILEAMRLDQLFSIVTAGQAWAPMLRETVALCGAAALFREVVILDTTGLAVARDAAAFRAPLEEAIANAHRSSVRTVILGGAGFAGMAESLRSDAALIDCIASATRAALGADGTAPAGRVAAASTGLSAELAALLARAS